MGNKQHGQSYSNHVVGKRTITTMNEIGVKTVDDQPDLTYFEFLGGIVVKQNAESALVLASSKQGKHAGPKQLQRRLSEGALRLLNGGKVKRTNKS